jgi:hypothetical protein
MTKEQNQNHNHNSNMSSGVNLTQHFKIKSCPVIRSLAAQNFVPLLELTAIHLCHISCRAVKNI